MNTNNDYNIKDNTVTGGGGMLLSSSFDDNDDNESDDENSQEPYYHIHTGQIVSAREAWEILAHEGHSYYQSKLSNNSSGGGGGGGESRRRGSSSSTHRKEQLNDNNDDSVFRSPPAAANNINTEASPSFENNDDDDYNSIQQVSSFSGPTQSSIDRALHPESPNYISPNKDIPRKLSSSFSYNNESVGISNNNLGANNTNANIHDDENEEENDPIILRAKAMALAAQNGQKLTPEQLQLIAQPDVQQQKLIEEAKRIHKSKELQTAVNLQSIGADLKKFIQVEKDKPATQWGQDLGKFIENQSMKISQQGATNTPGGGEYNGDGNSPGDTNNNNMSNSSTTPGQSPKRKMEGFGSDPIIETPNLEKASLKWPTMPPLPLLNESLSNMLPNKGGLTTTSNSDAGVNNNEEEEEGKIIISGIVWKRRSGFGKHSAIKAWEKRRVELRGSKLIYYKTVEEEQEEEEEEEVRGEGLDDRKDDTVIGPSATIDNAPTANSGNEGTTGSSSGFSTPRIIPKGGVGEETEMTEHETSATTPSSSNNNSNNNIDSSSKKLSIFSQAAQAAEQSIQNARDELTRLASVTGLVDGPRGVLDIIKEDASVSPSNGHSGAPTPFCLSIKVKNETKWKFCFDTYGMLLEWLVALTNVIVTKSLNDATTNNNGGVDNNGNGSASQQWEMEDYCVKRCDEMNDDEGKRIDGDDNVTSFTTSQFSSSIENDNDDTKWKIVGTKLYIAWTLMNVALIIARSSSTSIAQYWKLVVFTNLFIWQLCTRRSKVSSRKSSNNNGDDSMGSDKLKLASDSKTIISTKKKLHEPIAGLTTVQVAKEGDSNLNKNGHPLPSWVPISSRSMDVRSHGYLTTKTKIPSPGELYECIAVDAFKCNNRFPNVAPRVKFDERFKIHSTAADEKKTWKSPDIFIVSVAIPMEAPKFGQSTDDGFGSMIIGYFKMKEETRTILRRITAAGYDPTTDTASDSEPDVQKRIVNGVRLWEKYCKEAPTDPTFQARFKLIPAANLEELGCPSYIAKYNGKPVLIKRNQVTGFFNDYPNLNTMEFDISLHPFPYLFKQAMAYLKDYFDKSVWTFGFVIEGRNDDELPEVVIGAMKICRPSPNIVVSGEDFFAGTSPKLSD